MGDVGSLSLGAAIGTLAILLKKEIVLIDNTYSKQIMNELRSIYAN